MHFVVVGGGDVTTVSPQSLAPRNALSKPTDRTQAPLASRSLGDPVRGGRWRCRDGASPAARQLARALRHAVEVRSVTEIWVLIHNKLADQILLFIPWTTLNWTQVHHGFLPLWNPYSVLGMPQAFNWESAPFALPSLVGYLVPLRLAYTAAFLTSMVVAGTGVYVLGRVLRLGVIGCVMAATVFELSGQFIANLGWPLASVMSWSGWLFAFAILIVRGRHRPETSASLQLLWPCRSMPVIQKQLPSLDSPSPSLSPCSLRLGSPDSEGLVQSCAPPFVSSGRQQPGPLSLPPCAPRLAALPRVGPQCEAGSQRAVARSPQPDQRHRSGLLRTLVAWDPVLRHQLYRHVRPYPQLVHPRRWPT